MTDLTEHLYSYAQDHMIQPCLSCDRVYAESSTYAQEQEKRLRAALDGDGAGRLDDLLGELEIVQFARECAAFQAGFRIALELVRS